ncbi:MAG: RluA family pseudouridine synthase [Candidatus Marinimicrobia bacterium]|nr:RluA family pseudouridine synthase [Candidatus Neomarinimicrobiota bacterium]
MKNKSFLAKESGVRLDKYLSLNIPELSRTKLKSIISTEQVYVNGQHQKASYLVQENDKVEISFAIEDEVTDSLEPENIPISIIYEDEHLALINKPAGLVVHPGTGVQNGTLVNALMHRYNKLSSVNGNVRAGIVHRLDKDTSGVMIVALTNQAHVELSRQFENRLVKKVYIGITWGTWIEKSGLISGSIARKRTDPTSFSISERGRQAETVYDIEVESQYLSQVVFRPKTGRTHQIRVHANSMNHPIIGDEKYGGGISRIKGYIPEAGILLKNMITLLGRHALHAYQLSFTHPVTLQSLQFQAPIPNDMQIIIDQLKEDVRI